MKYLSFNELSLKLGGRSRSTIYRDVELGRLPKPVKIGGRIYWVEQKVDEVLEPFSRYKFTQSPTCKQG